MRAGWQIPIEFDGSQSGRRVREKLILDVARDFNFRLKPLLLLRDDHQLLDLARHVIKRTAEIRKLIRALHRNTPSEVALRDLKSALVESVHRARYRPAQRNSDDERDHLYSEQQACHDGEKDDRELSGVEAVARRDSIPKIARTVEGRVVTHSDAVSIFMRLIPAGY